MKNIIIILLLITFAYNSKAQVGEQFPEMSGVTLTDVEMSLPADKQDKFTLVGMAYSKKAEDDLKTWFQPVWETFIKEPEQNSLIPEIKADVHVVFIPMFTGIKQGASGAATKKMKKGIDEKLHPNVMVYKGKLNDYKDILDFQRKDTPYFFVVDKEGKIIYATSGKCSAKKITEVEEMVTDW
jgi:hypothetical protein